MESREALWVGGDWVTPAKDELIEVISPVSEEPVARVPHASEADVDRAVAAARAALENGPWPRSTPAERAALLTRIAEGIEARGQEIAATITREMGCPSSWSYVGQVLSSSMVFRAFADLATSHPFEEERAGMMGRVLVRRAPVGVAAAIVPWNVPLFTAALKVGAALAAGATTVLKPAPETPLDAFLFAEICADAGLPPGVLNVVPAGREVGEYLVRHPGVDKVGFTGSTAAGRRVGAICGEQLKRFTLELGGKSAAIVLDDADLAAAIPLLLPSAIMNSGQACIAQSRVLAPRRRYAEVVEALTAAVRALAVGDPADPAVQVGPMVAERQRARVLGYIEAGRREGARVTTGGGRPAGLARGWFVEPTVFADVDNRMTVAREEIFGPVISVIPYEDEADALRIANDSEYGLSGSVWTRDVERGIEVARRVRTGTYGVNAPGTLDLRNPFGGFKASGLGRELGPEGIDAYCEIQTVVLPPGYERA